MYTYIFVLLLLAHNPQIFMQSLSCDPLIFSHSFYADVAMQCIDFLHSIFLQLAVTLPYFHIIVTCQPINLFCASAAI